MIAPWWRWPWRQTPAVRVGREAVGWLAGRRVGGPGGAGRGAAEVARSWLLSAKWPTPLRSENRMAGEREGEVKETERTPAGTAAMVTTAPHVS